MPLRQSFALLVGAGLVLTGCASSTSGSTADNNGTATVLAAFYPLQYAAEQVGGQTVTVESLTPPGVEPHDVELSAQQVAAISEADLVLYIKGFQPAVDEAIAQQAPDTAVDVSEGIELIPADHAAEGESATDPHIWLDPLNMITIGQTIADRLTTSDKATTSANLAEFTTEMKALDSRWKSGTSECESRDLVVSHTAFGYLADRYDFTQVGISGLSPDAEPSPGTVADVADYVRANNVRTIYYETLVDPKVAKTLAQETGAETAVLDPLEGLPEGSPETYVTVMRANLASVREGQPCR